MKQHFIEYDNAYYRVIEIERKIEALETKLYYPNGIAYDRIPSSSSSGDNLAFKIAYKDELYAELSEAKEKLETLKEHFIKEIDALDDARQRSALRCWYIEKEGIHRIEDVLSVSERQAIRIKKDAENQFMQIYGINKEECH